MLSKTKDPPNRLKSQKTTFPNPHSESNQSGRKSDVLIISKRKPTNQVSKERSSLQVQRLGAEKPFLNDFIVKTKKLKIKSSKLKKPKKGCNQKQKIGGPRKKVSRKVRAKKLPLNNPTRPCYKLKKHRPKTDAASENNLEFYNGSKRTGTSSNGSPDLSMVPVNLKMSRFQENVLKLKGVGKTKLGGDGFRSSKVTPRKKSLKEKRDRVTIKATDFSADLEYASDQEKKGEDWEKNIQTCSITCSKKNCSMNESGSNGEKKKELVQIIGMDKKTYTQENLNESKNKKKMKNRAKYSTSLISTTVKDWGQSIIYQKHFQKYKYFPFRTNSIPLQKIIINIKVPENEYEGDWILKNLRVFSYRSNMNTKKHDCKLENDKGWGCMLRSGQMLLYNLILKESLKGVNLITPDTDSAEMARDSGFIFREIIKYFDFQNNFAPFSFKNIFYRGQTKFQMELGEMWDSPKLLSVVADCAAQFCPKHFPLDVDFLARKNGKEHVNFAINVQKTVQSLQIMNVLNGVVPETKVRQVFAKSPEGCLVMPFILRLGKENSDPRYSKFLFRLISLPWFTGMLGGKRKKAFFIFGNSYKISQSNEGFDNSKLLYLDPHYVQDMYDEPDIKSFSYLNIYRLDYKDLNASICVVFSFSSISEFEEFKSRVIELQEETLDCLKDDLLGHFIEFKKKSCFFPNRCRSNIKEWSGEEDSSFESSRDNIQVFNLEEIRSKNQTPEELGLNEHAVGLPSEKQQITEFVMFESKEMNKIEEADKKNSCSKFENKMSNIKSRTSNLSQQSWVNLQITKAIEDSPGVPNKDSLNRDSANRKLQEKLKNYTRKNTENTPEENSYVNHSIIERDSISEILNVEMSIQNSETNQASQERNQSDGDSIPRRDRLFSGQFEAIEKGSFNSMLNSNYSNNTESFRKYSESNGIESLENSKIRKTSFKSGKEGDYSVGEEEWVTVGTMQSSGRTRPCPSTNNNQEEVSKGQTKTMKHNFSKRNLKEQKTTNLEVPHKKQQTFHSSKNSMNKDFPLPPIIKQADYGSFKGISKKYSSKPELRTPIILQGYTKMGQKKPGSIKAVDSYELINSLSGEDSAINNQLVKDLKLGKQLKLHKGVPDMGHKRVISLDFSSCLKQRKGCLALMSYEEQEPNEVSVYEETPPDSVVRKKLKKSRDTIKAQ